MNERLLVIAAKWIVEMASSRPSLDDCRREVERRRSSYAALPERPWTTDVIADCDAWLAASNLHEEQKAMAERMRAAIAAAPQEALSDAERAEYVAELDQAMVQTGRVSNGEVLLFLLEKARKENEEMSALIARVVAAKKKTPKGTMITPDCAAVRKLALALDAMEAVVDGVALPKRPEFKAPPPRKRAKGRGFLEIVLPGCVSGSGAKKRGKKT